MSNSFNKDKRGRLLYLGLAAVAGFFAAIVCTAFRFSAQWVIHLSEAVYAGVRQNLHWLPALMVGAAALGLLASWIVSAYQSCKGGGIPTSVAAIRGIVPLRWLSSILVLPFSALVTFFCGIPLGTEGPCVQMGTAIGDGLGRCFGHKKTPKLRSYVMTGGASAGFSVATGSPLSALLFAVEELQGKCSPLLLAGVIVSVATAQITAQLLACLGFAFDKMFYLTQIHTLPAKLFFVPLTVGVGCGLASVLFTRFYHGVRKAVGAVLKKLPAQIFYPILFAAVSLVGVCMADALGTGHGLTESLLHTRTVWYLLLLVFLLRMVFVTVSNTAGVTGGMFLPTLAFGAVVGALCGEGMLALGLMEAQYYPLAVILGITAFLGANSRIPFTACLFAAEVLCGIKQLPALAVATAVAFLIAKYAAGKDITETVVAEKEAAQESTRRVEETVSASK